MNKKYLLVDLLLILIAITFYITIIYFVFGFQYLDTKIVELNDNKSEEIKKIKVEFEIDNDIIIKEMKYTHSFPDGYFFTIRGYDETNQKEVNLNFDKVYFDENYKILEEYFSNIDYYSNKFQWMKKIIYHNCGCILVLLMYIKSSQIIKKKKRKNYQKQNILKLNN